MKIKKLLSTTILLTTIFSATQVYADSSSLSMSVYTRGYEYHSNWAAANASIIEYYTGHRYYDDDILESFSKPVPYKSNSIDIRLLQYFGVTGSEYHSYPPFSLIKDRLQAGRPIEFVMEHKKTGHSRNVVVFSYTESAGNNYIGYIDPADGLKYTIKYTSFCDNSDFTLKECIFTGGDLSRSNTRKIDIKYTGNTDTGVYNIEDISMKNIENFKEAIMVQRDSYGLKASDNFDSITLGDPIEYYSISLPFLKGTNDTITDNLLKSEGYVFPLKLDNKNIGTAYVKYSEGKWQVNSISNGQLEALISKNNLKDTKLIIDRDFEIFGLLTSDSNSSYLIPLSDIYNLNMKKDSKVEAKDLLNSIKKRFKINNI
ncbi:hypothetical protein P8V03_12985 [Clostridium sp. A1-XYC3]|uniref:Peptidase C39-like domain-containing protein n=1 Tax=Clostridium tanneri TaxID=3037988 RepID=A0ABU4JV84_9CLOT|nr:hypothetical protein [Clostridium sp. A1-XYC3]MDW8802065.1 hypothetical protein [Clostridium sp. A1-XYC3]